MKTYVIFGILILIFIYLVIWTLKLHFYNQRQKKVRRVQELRAKGNDIKKRTMDSAKNYWYNLREIEDCKEGEDIERYYHYFDDNDEAVRELLLEMYDCGIVRTDELEEIAYGESRFHNADLSFLEDLERELEGSDFIVQLEEGLGDFFKPKKKDVVDAAKNLKSDDPGIMDIHGTLSDGVEDIIAAVDAEKKEETKKEEEILPKKEKSVEEARKVREKTANAEARKKIYEKWVGYVSELYEVIKMNTEEETNQKIRKALTDYGYNDVDVLLESPE